MLLSDDDYGLYFNYCKKFIRESGLFSDFTKDHRNLEDAAQMIMKDMIKADIKKGVEYAFGFIHEAGPHRLEKMVRWSNAKVRPKYMVQMPDDYHGKNLRALLKLFAGEAEDTQITPEEQAIINDCKERLIAGELVLFNEYYIKRFTLEELAEKYNVSNTAIKNRRNKVRRKLADCVMGRTA